MMKLEKIKIAIIDTGISPTSDAFCKIKKFYTLKSIKGNNFELSETECIDVAGHGTIVANIINDINTNIDFFIFRIDDSGSEIDEQGLCYILNYIFDSLEVNIINISLGVTYLSDYDSLHKICLKLYQKGVIIVSAFDNDGAVSYPAALEEVIGVDINNKIKDRKSIQMVNNSIIDIYVPNIYYRTFWNSKKTIVAGTSFAAARVTGLLSLKYDIWLKEKNKRKIMRAIADENFIIKSTDDFSKMNFSISKAIIFPLNKESRAILRFQKMLDFRIVGVYDERLNGNVGRNYEGFQINSYLKIDWEGDFDTIILSCTEDLSRLTGKDYKKEIKQLAIKYNKKIYTFERIDNGKNVFYPAIEHKMVPTYNMGKLHQTMIPVVGIMGTSSWQGKFTLQLELIMRLRKKGYSTGHLSTEPAGYLFGADYVYHFGYHANLKILPQEMIAILNEMIWRTQLADKDIIISGSQSNTVHYVVNNLENLPLEQYFYMIGIKADYYILCVNPHDSIEYISRTINFINSVDEGNVMALVLFPVSASETGLGLKYSKHVLEKHDLEKIKCEYETKCKMPTYILNDTKQLDNLTEQIINFFSEEDNNDNTGNC